MQKLAAGCKKTVIEDFDINIAEEIQHEIYDLPADLQAEVLGFIQRLKQEGGMVKPPDRPFPLTKLEDVVGCLRYHGPPKTVEEMDAGVAELVRSHAATEAFQEAASGTTKQLPSNRIGDGLDAFIGIWSEQEEQKFNAAVTAMEQIDEELWQ